MIHTVRLKLFGLSILSIIPQLIIAQSLSVGTPGLEDAYRRAQLLGKVDLSSSFSARPFYPKPAAKVENVFDPDSTLNRNRWTRWDGKLSYAKDTVFMALLPMTIQNKYSRPIPISMNDGSMIPARGFQTLMSAGVYFKVGPLEIQFQPEYLYAQKPTD